MKSRGLLLVISGPSGAGKGTICNEYLRRFDNTYMSVSCTTRKPRVAEIEGKSYYFIDKNDFERRIENNEFLEYAKVYDNYYGTPKVNVDKLLEEGKDVILEIDIQGALKVQENSTEGIFIFILPPSMDELRNRIEKRGSETPESLMKRFKSAFDEINYVSKYNYAVINNTVEESVKKVRAIVEAEKCRVSRVVSSIDTLRGEKI